MKPTVYRRQPICSEFKGFASLCNTSTSRDNYEDNAQNIMNKVKYKKYNTRTPRTTTFNKHIKIFQDVFLTRCCKSDLVIIYTVAFFILLT